MRDGEYLKIDSKPLWTAAVDGSANTDGKFDKASFETVFLMGSKDANREIEVRAKVTYADTLQPIHLPRTGFNAKAGMNFKVAKNRQQKSFFEIKIYAEYNAIFKHLSIGEEKDDFLGNVDFRLRIADDLWIPFTVKYDKDRQNFLGFLNITYNFGQWK